MDPTTGMPIQWDQGVTPQTTNDQNNFFGWDNVNYEDNAWFEAVNGTQPEENYDFNDFSPFNENEAPTEDIIEDAIAESTDENPVAHTSSDENKVETATGNQNVEILERFANVYGLTKKILAISEDKNMFSFSGGETVQSKIEYQIYLIEDEENHTDLFFKKTETQTESGEEEEHLIQWTYHKDKDKLDIFVDEVILYEIGDGHFEEEKRENMIIEKLNKFANFFEGYYSDLAKEVQRKKEIEERNRLLHEIFKNF